jgi:ferredoxin
MLWFLRGIRRGVVTTRYPRRTEPWAQQLPSPPRFDGTKLTLGLAQRLAAGCDARALSVSDGELLLDLGRCTGCGRCVELGGDAVEPSGWFELATHDRTALVKRVPIRGGGA